MSIITQLRPHVTRRGIVEELPNSEDANNEPRQSHIMTAPPTQPPENQIGGRWTVVVMFGFALVMMTALFVYWDLYTRPYRPLQYAIAERFPGSSPKVVGGQHKSHKNNSPVILRIVVNVPDTEFDPIKDEVQSEARALDLVKLAFQFHDVTRYEQIDVILLQQVPDSGRNMRTVSKSLDDWRSLVE